MTQSHPADAPVRITVVEAEGCHFCEDATDALDQLGQDPALDGAFEVELVDAHSAHGRHLIGEHRPALSPLVLLDGAFFSHGRLPRRKLARLLAERVG